MGYNRKNFEARGYDPNAYKRYFHNNQKEYVRKRLRCVQAYALGLEYRAISEQQKVSEGRCREYVNMYIAGGFEELCRPITRNQPEMLTAEQQELFRKVLVGKRPEEVGLEGNIWTGSLMRQYLKTAYGVAYKSGIYDLLERLGLSHQKAHHDYGNADPEEQAKFLEQLTESLLGADEQTAVVKFDEFSVCERPSSYYGWAEKNTRPKVVTDEKKENEPTGSSG